MEDETNRKCIATGKIKPKSELLRFVKTQDSRLIPDFNKKIAGRGLYVSVSRRLLQKALEKNLFTKSVHSNLKIEGDFVEMVEHLLFQKGINAINLARKAGALVVGFEKVKEKVLKNQAAFLIEARDVETDSSEKMAAVAKDLEILKVYDSKDLDAALNRVNTVHVAVLKSEIARMVYENLIKYQTFMD